MGDETDIANAMDLLECSVSEPNVLIEYVRLKYGQGVLDEATRRLNAQPEEKENV